MIASRTLFLAAFAASAASAQTDAAQTAKTLTSLVAAEVGAEARLDVLASGDVREVVAFEAEKQAVGCSDDNSCLAEVADALGTRYIVFGQLGRLGSLSVLTLNLFDSNEAQAVHRVVVRAETVEDFADALGPKVKELISHVPVVDEERTKILVLDVKPTATRLSSSEGAAQPAEVEDSGGPSLALIGGGGLAVAGLLGAVGGGVLLGLAAATNEEGRASETQVAAKASYETANLFWVSGWTVGAVSALALVGGASLAIIGMLGGEE